MLNFSLENPQVTSICMPPKEDNEGNYTVHPSWLFHLQALNLLCIYMAWTANYTYILFHQQWHLYTWNYPSQLWYWDIYLSYLFYWIVSNRATVVYLAVRYPAACMGQYHLFECSQELDNQSLHHRSSLARKLNVNM